MFMLRISAGSDTKRKVLPEAEPDPSAPSFSRSRLLLKSFVQYKDRLLLLAAYRISKSILFNKSIGNGDFTLLLRPEEGGRTKFIHGALDSTDTIGVRIVRGSHNGKEISIASFRKKHKVSHIQKILEAVGGKPYSPVEIKTVSFSQAIATLESLYKSHQHDPEKKAKLGMLLGVAMAENDGRNSLLMQFCGHDSEKFKCMHSIFKEIGQLVRKMQTIETQRMESLSITEDHLSVSKTVGSASQWPLSASQAQLILKRCTVEQRNFFLDWAQRYALTAFPRSLGVELLEKTCKESLDDLQGLLLLIFSKTDKKGVFFTTTEQFDKIFQALASMVDSSDAHMKKLKSWVHSDPALWLGAVCELAEKRKKILDKLLELEKISDSFHHELPYRKQMSLSLANIAVNLCGMGKEEVELWKEFASNKSLVSMLKSSKETNAMLKSATKFLSAAKREEEAIRELTGGVKAVREKYRLERISNEQQVLKKLTDLGMISIRLSNRLYEVYSDTKSHVSYKQRELPSSEIADAYFTRVRLMLMLKDSMLPDKFARGLEDCFRQNTNLFREFDATPELKREILQHIGSLLHIDHKGFDVEPDVSSLLTHGFRNQPIRVSYWLTEEIGPKSGGPTNILNLQFLNQHLKVELRSSLPYDEDFITGDFLAQSGEKFDEGIYGHKVALSDLIGPISGNNLEEIYSKVFQISTSETEKYLAMRKKLAKKDMESAHYLSTFASEENFSGTITSSLGRNLPIALDACKPNSFLEGLKSEYPDFETEAKEVQEYILKKAAIRILRHLHANLPYYMQKCAQAIASPQYGQQAHQDGKSF